MAYYKDTSGNLYYLSAEDITNGGEKLLPAGCVAISDTDAQAMQALPLADAQTIAWENIKTKRTQVQAGGTQVTVAGTPKWFHTDAGSRTQQLGLKDSGRDQLAAGGAMTDALTINGSQVQWKTMDGTFVALTVQAAFDIVAAVKLLDAEAFQVAETHRTNMLAASAPLSYDYSANWPVNYTGPAA